MDITEIDSIVNLFNYYKDEAGIDELRYDENRVLQTVKQYCIRPNLFFRVAYNGLRPVGLIGGFISEDPVEIETAATIQFCYLVPEFANTDNYDQLIQEFEGWAKLCNVTKIRAIDIGNNISRLDHIYDELGFNPIRIAIMNKEIA